MRNRPTIPVIATARTVCSRAKHVGRAFCSRRCVMRQLAALLTKERFAIGLLLLAISLAACLIPAQSDTWWQLRAGEEMWRSGRVMLHDEFTHTVAGHRWPNHEWLAQVLFYGVYWLGGLPLLTLVCAAAITAAWGFVVVLTPGPPLLRVATVGIAAVASSPAWTLRPQALTLGIFALTLWILVRRRPLSMLPLVFLVWANLHGAVALGGVVMLAAWMAAAVTDRESLAKLTVVGVLCLAATAATPLGPSLWFEIPQSLERLHTYGVHEWRAAEFTLANLPFWLAASAVLVLAIVRRRSLQSVQMLTLIAATALLFVLAARSSRNLPPFFVCAAPTITRLLRIGGEPQPRPEPEWRGRAHAAVLATAVAAAIVFVTFAWRMPLPRLRWTPLADTAITAVASCPGRLYNRFDEGGYLIWFMKDRKVFIDSRQDPFPRDLVLAHIEVERSGDYRAMFDRYDIGCSLTQTGSPLAIRLRRDGWHERTAARDWAVYRKPAVSHDLHTLATPDRLWR